MDPNGRETLGEVFCCEGAEMVTKTIKKNPDKKTSTKNMTYENMAIYIREQENAAIGEQTARNYMRMYRDANQLPPKHNARNSHIDPCTHTPHGKNHQ